MSDPRRRRQIKTPSGPKKKAAGPDLSKYKLKSATGRQEVPKPQPKPDPSQQRSGGRRGDQQRRQGGGQRGGHHGGRQGGRGQGRRDQPRPEPEALKTETYARILEHDDGTGIATAMAEKSLAFCRLKLKGSEAMALNQRIYIGKDASKRTEVAAIIGMAHLDKMSNMARQDLPNLVQLFSKNTPSTSWMNSTTRPAPCRSTALLRVAARCRSSEGRKHGESPRPGRRVRFHGRTQRLGQGQGRRTLAQRFVEEIEDKSLVPRLTELLLPVTA